MKLCMTIHSFIRQPLLLAYGPSYILQYCLLQSIMGNIELQQTYPKRKPIFKEKLQPTTEVKYEKENQFETIKKNTQIEQTHSHSQNRPDQLKTFRGRPKVEKIIRERVIPKDNKVSKESSRVNNINQFLIHLRKQMNQQSVRSSRVEQDDIEEEDNRNDNGSRQLVLNLKLQNERLQLQKYKGLVQRQLEKSHSIESIKIQGRDKQKKLIIKYEELKHNKGKFQNPYESDKKLSLEERIHKENSKYREKVEKAKKMFEELTQRTCFLEEMLERYQNQQQFEGATNFQHQFIKRQEKNPEFNESIRVQKIENLFKNIDALQSSQTLVEAKIKEALQIKRDRSESDLSSFQSEV